MLLSVMRLSALLIDVHVSYVALGLPASACFGVVDGRNGFVEDVGIWRCEDDVPGVQETRDETEHAEEDVED